MTSHHFNELKNQVAKQEKRIAQLVDIVCEQAKRIVALEKKAPHMRRVETR